jgi:hypothetical protein
MPVFALVGDSVKSLDNTGYYLFDTYTLWFVWGHWENFCQSLDASQTGPYSANSE